MLENWTLCTVNIALTGDSFYTRFLLVLIWGFIGDGNSLFSSSASDFLRNCISIVRSWDINFKFPHFAVLILNITLSSKAGNWQDQAIDTAEEYILKMLMTFIYLFIFTLQINIDYHMREATAKRAQDPTHTSFDEAQKTVYVLMERDSYPRFLKSKAYLNLLNQLQTNNSK